MERPRREGDSPQAGGEPFRKFSGRKAYVQICISHRPFCWFRVWRQFQLPVGTGIPREDVVTRLSSLRGVAPKGVWPFRGGLNPLVPGTALVEQSPRGQWPSLQTSQLLRVSPRPVLSGLGQWGAATATYILVTSA